MDKLIDVSQLSNSEIALMILKSGAVEIRDVPLIITEDTPPGKQPFLYASGYKGPGYVQFKGLVAQKGIVPILVKKLAYQITTKKIPLGFVAGNLTGGVIPGWLLSEELNIPFIYVKGTRMAEETTDVPIVMIDKNKLEEMAKKIVQAIISNGINFKFIAGLVPSSMILGYRISQLLSEHFDRFVPFVYIRESRKKGGQKELITGIKNNPYITTGNPGIVIGQITDFTKTTRQGMEILRDEDFESVNIRRFLHSSTIEELKKIEVDFTGTTSTLIKGVVTEELVNFAESTRNSTLGLRNRGLQVDNAATILSYQNPNALKTLEENKIAMEYVITLPELIDAAEENQTFSKEAINCYREFLKDPLAWQKVRGLKRVEQGGTIE